MTLVQDGVLRAVIGSIVWILLLLLIGLSVFVRKSESVHNNERAGFRVDNYDFIQLLLVITWVLFMIQSLYFQISLPIHYVDDCRTFNEQRRQQNPSLRSKGNSQPVHTWESTKWLLYPAGNRSIIEYLPRLRFSLLASPLGGNFAYRRFAALRNFLGSG